MDRSRGLKTDEDSFMVQEKKEEEVKKHEKKEEKEKDEDWMSDVSSITNLWCTKADTHPRLHYSLSVSTSLALTLCALPMAAAPKPPIPTLCRFPLNPSHPIPWPHKTAGVLLAPATNHQWQSFRRSQQHSPQHILLPRPRAVRHHCCR